MQDSNNIKNDVDLELQDSKVSESSKDSNNLSQVARKDSMLTTQNKKNEVREYSILSLILLCAAILWFYDIKLYGDIFRFLPIFLGLFMLYERKYRRVGLLIIVAIVVVGLVFVLKKIFGYLALHYGDIFVQIARRPINGEFSGFPSGHSAPAFLALGFAMYFYPKKWVFLVFILALLVPLSRVITSWHTPLQVICGSLIGLLFGYFLTMILDKILNKKT